ncbi:ras-related protein Rap-2a [Eurytemora carolleeae]|uniref:ras-related protein Rap-2a n=1 Tax=Eurytemora carolleeae TaxID=1294199 RepID=UPI000C776669|nr:ras-related protein Rap-2a [Eurytemora carolleeae]|eukprot:XP_023349355.1 ras-related protein Rap-2a-like [Eurytemora affinis]
MRDQTAHMREKYQSDPSKLNQRRLSTKTPIPIITKSGSRNNSLPSEEVEVTRQFLATSSKVVNRGDSFKRKTQYTRKKKDTTEDSAREIPRVEPTSLPEHVYRVAFLGCSQVGKSSIIEQFMSSDHADVYERSGGLEPQDSDMDIRRVSVDVNGEESRLDLIEAAVEDLTVKEVVEDQNPDCFVIVYAVDDKDSLKYADSCLDWLSKYGSLLEKPCILVGNKSDLARSRVIEPTEGCDLAVKYQVKFTESSPGCGHMVDELLVGIVLQLRLYENKEPKTHHRTIKETVRGLLSLVTGKEEERRKQCRNLNV